MSFSASLSGSVFEVDFNDGGPNLLSSAALSELGELIDQVPSDAALLLFRSSHPSIFAAGADMREMSRFSATEAEDFSKKGQELFRRIENLPLLTVALIDGDCFGGALDLAMAFDLRLSSLRSRYSHPGARLGIVTGFGGTSRWRKLLSRADGRRLLLGSAVIGAAGALKIGLVDAIVDDDSAGALLARLSAGQKAKIEMRRKCLRDSQELSYEATHLLARRAYDLYSRERGNHAAPLRKE